MRHIANTSATLLAQVAGERLTYFALKNPGVGDCRQPEREDGLDLVG